MSERLILFRYHGAFDICASRLELLRKFNPGKQICGLYGGPQEGLEEARSLPLDSFYSIPMDDPWWKWANGDLCVRWWFRDVGHQLSFDFAHMIEWDMLLLRPIDELFAHVRDGVALSVIRRSGNFDLEGLIWTAAMRGAWELDALRALLRERYQQEVDTHWAGFCGAVLSRNFLERYSEEVVPSYCNDEIRVSAFAQAYGMKVHDTPTRVDLLQHEPRNRSGRDRGRL